MAGIIASASPMQRQSKNGDTAGFEYRRDVEVVKLVADGEGDDRKIRERALGLQGYGVSPGGRICFFPEYALTDDIRVAVQLAV